MTRTSTPPRRMSVVHREDIPTLRTVVVDGVDQSLGILKDFGRHPEIAPFIPADARLAMAWVRLEPGECLETHIHPIESMIVVAQGHGRTAGDLDEDFAAGDVVLIPRGCHHGFMGAGDAGFWALSIQFEERGLYEDVENLLVLFDDDQPCESEGDGAGRAAISEGREPATLELLMERNRLRVEQHLENPLLLLLGSGQLAQPEIRRRFLDVVQVWSTHFQRALFARSAFTDNVAYGDAFRGHLAEEFGHDQLLADDRGGHPTTVWDPILDATASWFSARMLSADDADKAVLIHLVLEAGADVVSQLGAHETATGYFAAHENDDAHRAQGEELLSGLDERTYERLLEVHARGWDVLEVLSARMAHLTLHGS